MQTLQAKGLTKTFKGRRVVDNVDIDLKGGEVVGLLGPNGAGKTTSFYMVVGLTKPDSGSIHFGEDDITNLPMYLRARRGISYLPQEASVFRKLTVRENILAILETLPLTREDREERLFELMGELGVTHISESKAYALSGGERRRVEIARALVISPSFILLDEPFAGIDPIAVMEIQGLISHLRSKGIGVLITDHNVRETLGICDRAYILSSGKIVESGTPEEIAGSERARKVYLGEKFRL